MCNYEEHCKFAKKFPAETARKYWRVQGAIRGINLICAAAAFYLIGITGGFI